MERQKLTEISMLLLLRSARHRIGWWTVRGHVISLREDTILRQLMVLFLPVMGHLPASIFFPRSNQTATQTPPIAAATFTNVTFV